MKEKQRRLSHQEKNELFRMFETGDYSGNQLTNYFPISQVAINALLRRNGYKSKSPSELKRKYPIVEDFFDEINTEEKAYILGLLYADGWNQTERNVVGIGLKESDKEILDKITALIQPSKPLQYVDTQNNGFENSKNQYRLIIANKHISQRLVELGCGKAKTHNLIFPTEEQVPSHLIRHFVRGYFDGDGSVSKGKISKVDIIGTTAFLEPLQEILFNELSLNKTLLNQRHKERDNTIRSLQISGNKQCIKFREWLYEDSTIYLERKFDVFHSYMPFQHTQKKCSIEGCGKKHSGKGYCKIHHYEFCGGKEKRRERFIKTGF
jgi:hypothetical protein